MRRCCDAAGDRQGPHPARRHARWRSLSSARAWAKRCKAADKLAAMGLSTTLADARFAKPLDEDLIRRLAREHEVLITIEEGALGGFGAFVLHFLATDGVLDRGLKVRTLTLPDIFQDHDKPERHVRRRRPRRRRHRPRRTPRARAERPGGGGAGLGRRAGQRSRQSRRHRRHPRRDRADGRGDEG